MDNCGAGPCPNGHRGIIIDGTYKALDKLYAFFKSAEGAVVIPAIEAVARSVGDKNKIAEDGLDEIANLLPTPDLQACLKQLGVKNPLVGILIVLSIISSLVTIGANASAIYKNLSPSLPTAPTIIINNNNNPKGTNKAAPEHGGRDAIPYVLKNEQVRRLKQKKAREEKLARKAMTESPKVCQPGHDPKIH